VHIFDPVDALSASDANAFIDDLVAGLGGNSAYTRLGGGVPFQSDFGSAVLASNDFISQGIVDLDIDGIARALYASNGQSNGRFSMGARLEDFSGTPITGADDLEHYLFGLTGSALCPGCGATLVMAEIPIGTEFPIPEPPMQSLLAIAGVASLVARRRRSRQAHGCATGFQQWPDIRSVLRRPASTWHRFDS
jgi:hypothetical protein